MLKTDSTKKGITDTQNTMDNSKGDHTKRKKPDTKDYILYDLIYMQNYSDRE